MKSFYKYLIPSLIASVLMSMYIIVDGMFVGQKVGDLGLVAINVIWPVTAFLQGIGLALGLSGGILISTFMGKSEIIKANKVKLTTLIIIIVLGIIFGLLFYFIREPLIYLLGASEECYNYALEYLKVILAGSVFQMLGMAMIPLLRNSGKVKLAMTASLVAVGVNLVLDYVFLYIFNMELAGAALASVMSQVISFTICLLAYYKELKGVLFNKEIFIKLFTGAIAPFILNYSSSIIIIITNIVAMHYGSNEAVAAYTLLSYILYIIVAVSCAVGDSIQPLFSYYEAKNEKSLNYKMLKKCILISFSLCVIYTIIILIFKKELGVLYNLSDKAYLFYETGLIYYIIGFLFVSVIKVISSFLYAVNDKKYANLIIVIEPFILTPFLLLLFSYLFETTGVWISYLGVQLVLFIISLFIIIKKRKKDISKDI